jgi:hypothetical protein
MGYVGFGQRPERHNSGNFAEALIIPAKAHVQAWKA